MEQNIRVEISAIKSSSLFEVVDNSRGLMNGFTKQAATKEQQHDLLNFRGIGLEEFLLRVSCLTLRQPSVRAPDRRKKLLTVGKSMIDWVFGPDTLNTECSDSEVDEPVNT